MIDSSAVTPGAMPTGTRLGKAGLARSVRTYRADGALASLVIAISILVIIWDLFITLLRSMVFTARDAVRYRLIRGSYNTVMYRWRWRIQEKLQLVLRRRR